MNSERTAFSNRIQSFQKTLTLDQIVILSSAKDIEYFTQFEFLVPEEREAFLVVTSKEAFLIISAFSPAPTHNFLTILRGTSPTAFSDHIKKIIANTGVKKILIQEHSLFVSEFSALHKAVDSSVQIGSLGVRTIWQFRMIKDELELTALRKAGQVGALVAKEIEKFFVIGVTEFELSEKMAELFKKHGSEGLGFPTIVAFGAHGTSPHHQPGNTPLTEDTSILIDCGAKVAGYRSDLTRTWWFGKKVPQDFKVVEGVVKTAYELAVAELNKNSGKLTAKAVDEITRTFITREGYGPQFIHTTGHGVGLDIHEPPSLSWSDETVLKPGMVITIEPGIYLEKKFGYRYENTLLITQTGTEILTDSLVE